MSGDLEPAGLTESLAGRARWAAIVLFAAATAGGAIWLNPSAPAAVAGAVVAVGAAVPLVLGRRPVLLYAAVATAGIAMLGHGMSNNVGWIAVCLIATWCVLMGSRLEGLLYWAGAMILFAVEWLAVKPDPGWGAWLAGVTLTAAFGLLIRHDRDLLRQLRQAQAGLAQQARAQERNRIARELQTLSATPLRSACCTCRARGWPWSTTRRTRRVPWPRPNGSAASASPKCVPRSASSARTTPRNRTAPLPGAGGLPALAEQFRSAGADVTLTVEGDTARLPATTGLAVYRIAQEALTNAAKHAPGAPTEVRLRVSPGEVTLTADSRTAPGQVPASGTGAGTGLGVLSMRERAESVGGSCETGPGGRGWLVRARLPLTGVRP